MENLKKAFDLLLQNKKIKSEIESAKDEFAFKPFALAYLPLAKIAKISRYGLAAFSIITGFGCLYFGMVAALPEIAAAILAVLALLLVETLKGQMLYISFRETYANGKLSLLLIGGLLFTAISVFVSLKGVETLYLVADSSGRDLEVNFSKQYDSLMNAHTQNITDAKKELEAFKKSISWKGKIDMYNKSNAAVIKQLNERIALAETDKRKASELFQIQKTGALLKQSEQAGFNITLWIFLSGFNESLILFFVWFSVYYRYRIATDCAVFDEQANIHFTVSDVRKLIDTVQLHSFQLPTISTTNQQPAIGFKIGQNKPETGFKDVPPHTPQNAANGGFKDGFKDGLNPFPADEQAAQKISELQAYLAKYPDVVNCVKQGISTAKTAKQCGVSESTVHNVKRCLRVLTGYGVNY
jgi:hypothetical protein